MALDEFRIEGVGLIQQKYLDTTGGAIINFNMVSNSTPNDHTTVDNVDSAGNDCVWTQPQPRIEIYNMIISVDNGGLINFYSGAVNQLAHINLGSAQTLYLGAPVKRGYPAPIFVCNANESFDCTSATSANYGIYLQYRIVTPKN